METSKSSEVKPKLGDNWRQRTYYKRSSPIDPLSQSLIDFPPVRIDADCLLAIKIVTALLI